MLKGLIKNSKMGKYELENGFASYRTIVDYYIGDCVLCNNLPIVDDSIYYNMNVELDDYEICQYYLCNIDNNIKDELTAYGLKFSYSDLLDCDVLCVTHYGTSWDYVLTECKLYDTFEELEKDN